MVLTFLLKSLAYEPRFLLSQDFPLCSSLTLHESRNLGLYAGSLLVLSFCLSSTTHCHNFLVELLMSFDYRCLALPFFIQVWHICTKTVYVVWHGLTVLWTCCAFGWSLIIEQWIITLSFGLPSASGPLFSIKFSVAFCFHLNFRSASIWDDMQEGR